MHWTVYTLHMIFFDLIKAFDFVNREALWYTLQKPGFLDNFFMFVPTLSTGMEGLSAEVEKYRNYLKFGKE